MEVTLLGITQDGGLPQVGCLKDCCKEARLSPELSKMPVSLGIQAVSYTHLTLPTIYSV